MRPLPRRAPERAKRRSMRHDARMRTSSIVLPALVLALSCAGNVPLALARDVADSTAVRADGVTDAIAFPSPADRRWQTGFVRRDRLQHASLSFVLAGACRTAGRRCAELSRRFGDDVLYSAMQGDSAEPDKRWIRLLEHQIGNRGKNQTDATTVRLRPDG